MWADSAWLSMAVTIVAATIIGGVRDARSEEARLQAEVDKRIENSLMEYHTGYDAWLIPGFGNHSFVDEANRKEK